MIEFFLKGLGLGLAAAAQPGPFQAYLLSRALRGGWRGTWMAAFAPLLSDGPVVLAALFFLSQVPDWFARGLRAAGGIFLLYLARTTLRSLNRASTPAETPPAAAGQTILQSALMNLLSPGPWIFWTAAAGPLFLDGWKHSPTHGLGFLGGFYLAMVSVLLGLIALFSAAGRLDARLSLALRLLSGLGLLAFGLYQLWMGIAGA